ncbi:hypothetical protein [Luteolibacter luteus]|uniref:Uncharacterized protein n=1 Tax=Luteolibacter luteus TaxID=2728835 RepID=A0A858RFB0_9BACT|nr:hypothetical protein [Luteolibacter luteus]QJE95238.1 hypothetical protein HHL09_05430 [Luteolibacter luteus]
MPDPDSIPVPVHILQRLLRLADEGMHARITWDVSREKMDRACIEIRGEKLKEIQEELEQVIPANRRRP